MGKIRKGYNWQARSVPTVEIDKRATNSVEIEISHRKENYDECNSLVLPSTKRKTIKKDKQAQSTRLLSKKRRKQLEKVLEKKQKKQRRAGLLEDLAKVQATAEELKQYVSITDIQTKGLKRHFREENYKYVEDPKDDGQLEVVNAIKGSKKRRLMALKQEIKEKYNDDPNVVGLEESESEKSDEDEETSEENDEEDAKSENNNDKDENTQENHEEDERDAEEDVSEDDEEKNIKETSKKGINKENVKQTGINGKPVKKSQQKLEKTAKSEKNSQKIDQSGKPGKKSQQNIENPEKINKKSKPDENSTEISKNSSNEPSKPAADRKPAVFVSLNRKPEIQACRMKLPVLAEEQVIVEAINENPVVVIIGETGSGKTTQIPQFLYEAGYAKNRLIGVTEPRRVAAISMSKRVAEEMNLTTEEVSYLIRFEGNTTDKTKIKFMTDGVLLKEVQSDFLLTKYSVIILDEAHERSVYTDILIGLLSRIVPMRAKRNDPLKLIVMSATFRVEDFLENSRLFKIPPPLIKVESRQFPVTIHFNRRTSTDYVLDAIKKAAKIHTKLPEGGILIFLTGQHEVNTVVRRLRKLFPYKQKTWEKFRSEKEAQKAVKSLEESQDETNSCEENDSEEEFNARTILKRLKSNKKLEISLPSIDLDQYSSIPEDDTQGDLFDDENPEENLDEDEEDDDFAIDLRNSSNQPMWVLPLYSLLPAHKQARVFEAVPEGCRLCVVATNVAETSLTIPNVKYVVDSGKCKTRMYDRVTGVSTYRVTWTSQAGANQRAGRTGRVGPGHCYRLYSSAVFNDQFEKFSVPEIQRKPVDDLVLQMKVMNIVKVVNFPFPSAPEHVQLISAEKRLRILGALESKTASIKDEFSAKATSLGKSIAAFPVAPRFGKMLAISQQENLLKFTICMVSALSVQEVLVEGLESMENKKKWLQTRRFWAGTGNSLLLGDPMVLIRAVGAAQFADSQRKLPKFCEENGLRPKALTEIRKLRNQLTNEIAVSIPGLELVIDPKMAPPTDAEAKLLRQIILAGMADQIAKKISPDEIEDQDKTKFKFAYRTLEMEEPVFMHSCCVLRKNLPEWVVYQEIYETNKVYMRGVTAIEPEWLPKFVPALCNLGEPLLEPPPRFDPETGTVLCHLTGTFGRAAWELPPMEVEFPTNADGVRWFARFFLEGAVCPKLKRFASFLLSNPSTINKSWAKLIPRNEAISMILLSRGVMSKNKLLDIWKTERSFLMREYKMWLPESAHAEICTIWPPV